MGDQAIGCDNWLYKENNFLHALHAAWTCSYIGFLKQTWNLIQCTLLWLLNIMLWFLVGWAIGRAVPSINPQQFGSAAPFASTAREKVSISSQTKSKDVRCSLNSSYTVFRTYKIIIWWLFSEPLCLTINQPGWRLHSVLILTGQRVAQDHTIC